MLHIGYPKTGTTSLQRFLDRNREPLREQGILYPSPSPQHNLAWSLPPGYRFDPESLTFEGLADEIRRSEADVVLLSSEEFVHRANQNAAARRVRTFADGLGAPVDAIVFVRPQHAYINSLYTQRAKFLNSPGIFSEFVDGAVRLPLIDYSRRLTAWGDIRNMRLIPVPFTGTRLKPSLESVFFSAAGIGDRVGGLLDQDPGDRINTSPGPLTVEVYRRLFTHLDDRGQCAGLDREQRSTLSHIVLRLAGRRMPWDTTPFNGLDNDLREKIDRHFRESNKGFAEKYWGTDWYEVFADEYRRDLASNDFERAGAEARDRRAVNTVTRLAIERATQLLDPDSPADSPAPSPTAA